MDDRWLAERFEAERARLHSVAYRLLGSANEADDALQESWLRLARSYSDEVENLGGWLTTIVARVCLDMLRKRRSRREEPLAPDGDVIPDATDPEHEAVLADSVGLAMLAVVERLTPAERVAFVLHDVSGVSFDEIATVVGRSPDATRQLASRGRRRVQGVGDEGGPSDVARHREVVAAFFKASRDADFEALLAVLDPEVVLRPDAAALRMGRKNGWITGEIRGAEAVAARFSGQAQAARVALIDGVPGGVWSAGGRPIVVFGFTVVDGKVLEVELAADGDRLSRLQIEVLEGDE